MPDHRATKCTLIYITLFFPPTQPSCGTLHKFCKRKYNLVVIRYEMSS